jgi:hypothetical protein
LAPWDVGRAVLRILAEGARTVRMRLADHVGTARRRYTGSGAHGRCVQRQQSVTGPVACPSMSNIHAANVPWVNPGAPFSRAVEWAQKALSGSNACSVPRATTRIATSLAGGWQAGSVIGLIGGRRRGCRSLATCHAPPSAWLP